MRRRILVIDDCLDICLTIKQYLENHSYDVDYVNSATEALQVFSSVNNLVQETHYDLLILDIMMENLDGIKFCSLIRDKISCPIIFVSAKSLEEDKLEAFAVGGDDYICKPFSFKELKARVDSHLRREERIKQNTRYLLSSKNIVLDKSANEIYCNGVLITLTKKEYGVIELLMLNKNIVFSKDHIFDKVWGIDSNSYLDTVTESIKNIRKKFRRLDQEYSYITTMYGLGYKWEVKDRHGTKKDIKG